MGLALSLAIAFMISQGMKNVFGKPRPNLLGRCQPDLANYKRHIIGGNDYASEFNMAWVLVGATICKNPDTSVVKEGFRSFPSAHASCKLSSTISNCKKC
jgi:membrane-associated phospholipid phosphatase